MKKIALTSLMAVMAVSGARAANVIDGNPLYMPGQNHFYSVTSVESHTKNNTPWTLGEDFGYGILDNWSIELSTNVTENNSFDYKAWDDLELSTALRVLDVCNWKLDLLGGYGVGEVRANHRPLFDKDYTEYLWTAGVRGGFVSSNFTIAAKALFEYLNTESFNWNEKAGKEGEHYVVLGLDGQFVIDSNWNLVAGVEYTGRLDKEDHGVKGDKVKNEGEWNGEFGVNYNIDATKFVGAYINGSLNHQGGSKHDEWDWDKGFGYGVKFGIDF